MEGGTEIVFIVGQSRITKAQSEVFLATHQTWFLWKLR